MLDSKVNNQYSKLGVEYAFIHFWHEEYPPVGFFARKFAYVLAVFNDS